MGIAVSPLFRDPDGDSLTFTVESRSVAAWMSGGFVELDLNPPPPGGSYKGDVLVTATDPSGRTADLSLRVAVVDYSAPWPPFGLHTRSPIPSRQLRLGQISTISLRHHFGGPPGTTFGVTSSSPAVQASISGDSLVLDARSLGPAEIVVTAEVEHLSVHQVFDVVVDPREAPPNEPPSAPLRIPARYIPLGVGVPYPPSEHFHDPEGRPLTFSATSEEPNAVAVFVSGSNVVLEGRGRPGTDVTLVATDPGGLTVRTRMWVSPVEVEWIQSRRAAF